MKDSIDNGNGNEYIMLSAEGPLLVIGETKLSLVEVLAIWDGSVSGDCTSKSGISEAEMNGNMSLNVVTLERIRRLVASGRVTELNQISLVVQDVRSKESISLTRFLEDHNIWVYSPGSVLFFEREEVMLLVGCLIHIFPDYMEKLSGRDLKDSDGRHLSYYDTCLEFAREAMRGISGAPLKGFVERSSRLHHRLYMATDYSFSGILYRLLEFEPFSSWMKNGGIRELRNIAIFTRMLTDFEKDRNIFVLEPKSVEAHVEELFNGFLSGLFSGGTGRYELDNPGIKGCVGIYGLRQIRDIEAETSSGSLKKVLSVFGDLDEYAGCSLKYWLNNVIGFKPSRTMRSVRDEMIIDTIRNVNSIIGEYGFYPFAKDALNDVLDLNSRSMGIEGIIDGKLEASALKQIMRYFRNKENSYEVIASSCTERLTLGSYDAEGSFAVIEAPSGEFEAVAMFSGKVPGEAEVIRKAGLLQMLAGLHEERTDEWISRIILFFAGEDKKDPYVVFDTDDRLIKKGLQDAHDSVVGIFEGKHSVLSSDREVCLACDFRFHCKRTGMRKT